MLANGATLAYREKKDGTGSDATEYTDLPGLKFRVLESKKKRQITHA